MGRKRDHINLQQTIHTIQKMVSVKENWYPCFNPSKKHKGKGGQVLVAVYPQHKHVVVHGADDYGMERRCETLTEAMQIYNLITDGVTCQQLEQLGLVYW